MDTVENMLDVIVGNIEAKEYIVALTWAWDMLIETIGAYINKDYRKNVEDIKLNILINL
jgi:hypothetical protein